MASNSKGQSSAIMPAPWYRRLQPRTVLAILAALALLDAGLYLLAVRPARLGERAARERIERLTEQVAATRRGIQDAVAAAKRVDDAETSGDALVQEIALSRQHAFSALLTELGAAATESGIEVRESSYVVEPIEGSEHYGILAINANFRGRYENLVKLLYELDRSELFFIIGSLGATPRDDSGSNELQINMRFDTFVRDL